MKKSKRSKKEAQYLDESKLWDQRRKGLEEESVSLSDEETKTLLREKLDLQRTTINLPLSVIQSLKKEARALGIGYQPYVRQLLIRHIESKEDSLVKRVEKLEKEISKLKLI